MRGPFLFASTTGAALFIVSAMAAAATDGPGPAGPATPNFAAWCTSQAVSAIAAGLGAGVTIHEVPNGPRLPGGVKLNPASGKVPATCRVTGSYVTNPKTGKTANFLATFPAHWNQKYLQLGCSGTCGYLRMNDPAAPPITVTAQGYPGQLLEKGYAVFGNDLGHVAPSATSGGSEWLKNSDGTVNAETLADYLYRADLVMADMGKAFTRAFYGQGTNAAKADITRSYFSGCSQGGREALVAATRFPEKFDGIIAGSPVSDQPGVLWHVMGQGLLAQKLAPMKFTPGQMERLKARVVASCDALDGVKDGLIQNPAACNIQPDTILPVCKPGRQTDDCVSKQQSAALSVYFSGVTDARGAPLQPGFPISDQSYVGIGQAASAAPADLDMRYFVGHAFDGMPLATYGDARDPHIVANVAAYKAYVDLLRRGVVMAEDFGPFFKRNGKLLWYHNLSDEALTPYMSFNRYRKLAADHGGYARLQENIRFFAVPGSGHCGMGGPGPSNFDAIGALEKWVEEGEAPQALLARQLDPANSNILTGQIDWSKPPLRTMPLCTFPQMARYKGKGYINAARNWECAGSDRRMLTIGRTGREAGVTP
ncbi:tannase/feruloyl esterase family alpha/beta hydrolase [Novosphingobium lindaniclasticum]|uniref:Feruloyl esterase n=1 Tax=Novosphingobium lindaniclasticum LE124 TaxID=1096930 RepID=T0J4H8_9SPHN|nr:tannase/feruloyl esterase family alpha/beta hydrolase [Novosphingobium lindaniclasticum]EQB16844.1 hypothetical protein L284_09115 [Novosphingobium lindaniclasticum LE124]